MTDQFDLLIWFHVHVKIFLGFQLSLRMFFSLSKTKKKKNELEILQSWMALAGKHVVANKAILWNKWLRKQRQWNVQFVRLINATLLFCEACLWCVWSFGLGGRWNVWPASLHKYIICFQQLNSQLHWLFLSCTTQFPEVSGVRNENFAQHNYYVLRRFYQSNTHTYRTRSFTHS